MKKIHFFPVLVMFVTVLSLIFVSCKKEEEKQIVKADLDFKNFEGFNVKIQENVDQTKSVGNDWLYFETRNDYETAVKVLSSSSDDTILPVFEKALSFRSMRTAFSESQREAIAVYDDVLATLLNPNGAIQIGQYLFQIDTEKEKAHIFDLSSEKNSKAPMEFSTDESFFDYLDGKVTEEHEINRDEDILKSTHTWEGSTGKVDCKVVYQRAVIYFSLLAKIKERTLIGNGGAVDIFLSTYPGTYTKNRKNAEKQQFDGYGDGGIENTYKYRPYSAACGLKQLYMCTNFYMKDGYQPTLEQQLYIIKGQK